MTKFTLGKLQVKSFTTTLDHEQQNQITGGIFTIKGRQYTYRPRWTSIDTRTDNSDTANLNGMSGA